MSKQEHPTQIPYSNMRDHYKHTEAILWRITYTSNDFTFLHCHIFYINIFLIQHFKNYKHNILFPRLFFPCYVHPHKNINFEVSVPCKLSIHILLFLSSTWLWPFRPKCVVESNRINCCVLTGFIVIIILLSYTGMKFVLSAWQRFEKRLLKAILLGKQE